MTASTGDDDGSAHALGGAASGSVRIEVIGVPVGMIGTNCYIAHPKGSSRAVIVDPGDDAPRLLEAVREHGLDVEAILVTHCHWDHIGAVAPVARELGVPVYMSRIEAPVLADINSFVPAGFGPYESWTVDHELEGGETLDVGGMRFDVLLLPGHSPGTLGFLAPGVRAKEADADPDGEDDGWIMPPLLFDGDLLFRDSIGRHDLPFADGEALMASIGMLLETLPDATVLLPGHGEPTTLGRERRMNPFLRDIT